MPADDALALPTCVVCGESIDPANSAICNNCHRPYHLRLRHDDDGPECGEVWINEQFLSLEHACYICLGRRPEPGSQEPPVGVGH